MIHTEKIERAIRRATELHDGGRRKNKETPYIAHPFSVVLIAQEYTDDEDTLCAALLHDTLEDVKGYDYRDLVREFGERVADIVDGVTQADMVGGFKGLETREEKLAKIDQYREITLQKLKDGPAESAYVSAADKIHNIQDLVTNVAQFGDEYLERFVVPMDRRFAGYRTLLAIIRKKIDSPITDRLEQEIEKAEKIFL